LDTELHDIALEESALPMSSIYKRLKEDLLNGDLEPGERLVVDALKKRYVVGISPIREALSHLTAEGLVRREDKKGFRVSDVSAADLKELVEIRCLIEEPALRRSINLGDQSWEEQVLVSHYRLVKCKKSLSESGFVANAEWERLHRAFHLQLIAACGYHRLVAYSAQHHDFASRYIRLAMRHGYGHLRDPGKEHQEIMDAALARDADRAVALMKEHLHRTANLILERYDFDAQR